MATKEILVGESVQIGCAVENRGNASGGFWVGCSIEMPGINPIDIGPYYTTLNPAEGVNMRFTSPSLTMTGNYSVQCALWSYKPIRGIPGPAPLVDSGKIYNAIQVNPEVEEVITAEISSSNIRWYGGYISGGCRIKNTSNVRHTFYVGFSARPDFYGSEWEHTKTLLSQLTVTLNPGEISRDLIPLISPKHLDLRYECVLAIRSDSIEGTFDKKTAWVQT